MSQDNLTFWLYLQKNSNDPKVAKFKSLFVSELDQLPNRVTSSRQLRQILKLDSIEKEYIFRNVWLGYFKTKITQ
jgi:hypothetical protein